MKVEVFSKVVDMNGEQYRSEHRTLGTPFDCVKKKKKEKGWTLPPELTVF